VSSEKRLRRPFSKGETIGPKSETSCWKSCSIFALRVAASSGSQWMAIVHPSPLPLHICARSPAGSDRLASPFRSCDDGMRGGKREGTRGGGGEKKRRQREEGVEERGRGGGERARRLLRVRWIYQSDIQAIVRDPGRFPVFLRGEDAKEVGNPSPPHYCRRGVQVRLPQPRAL